MPRLQGGGGLAAAVLGMGIKVVMGVEGLLGAEGCACRMVGRRRVDVRRVGERRVGKTSGLFGRTCSLLALVSLCLSSCLLSLPPFPSSPPSPLRSTGSLYMSVYMECACNWRRLFVVGVSCV